MAAKDTDDAAEGLRRPLDEANEAATIFDRCRDGGSGGGDRAMGDGGAPAAEDAVDASGGGVLVPPLALLLGTTGAAAERPGATAAAVAEVALAPLAPIATVVAPAGDIEALLEGETVSGETTTVFSGSSAAAADRSRSGEPTDSMAKGPAAAPAIRIPPPPPLAALAPSDDDPAASGEEGDVWTA